MKFETKRRGKFRNICEVHRELYRELKRLEITEDSEAIKLLREAFPIGKKMWNKLRQYKYGFDDGWYEKNRFEGGEIEKQ